MTPAEAQKAIDEVRVKRPRASHLRVVGSIENPQADGPGAKLQYARQEQGLSVVQVAEALCLKPYQVAAIESVSFSKMPGLGYALGYVRAYAELVNLDDVNSLVEDFRDAWAPQQNHNEKVRAKNFDARFVLPIGAVALAGLIIWGIIGVVTSNVIAYKKEEITTPDAAITAWVHENPKTIGNSVVSVDPLIKVVALRNVRINLRGQDGALVADRFLKAGESIPAEGLGRFIITSDDAGAIEVRGFGETVRVGNNHQRAEWWRVPDLQLMAQQRADALAAIEAQKAQEIGANANTATSAKSNNAASVPNVTASVSPSAVPVSTVAVVPEVAAPAVAAPNVTAPVAAQTMPN
jgi:transcriptional regulator with XRE-family HTH domain